MAFVRETKRKIQKNFSENVLRNEMAFKVFFHVLPSQNGRKSFEPPKRL